MDGQKQFDIVVSPFNLCQYPRRAVVPSAGQNTPTAGVAGGQLLDRHRLYAVNVKMRAG